MPDEKNLERLKFEFTQEMGIDPQRKKQKSPKKNQEKI